jgi:uncharacterized membrane protein (UPF0182 family)
MNRRRLAGVAIAAALVLLFGGRWIALRYAEHAWYASLGLQDRFWALLARSAAVQLAVLAATLGWYAATTLGVYRSIGSVHLPRRLGNLEIAEAVPRPMLHATALAIAAVLALATTYAFADLDHLVALYRHAGRLGVTEPVLGRDAAFYLAKLPLLETLHLLATLSVLLAVALAAGLYALTGSLAVSRRRLQLTPHARTHLTLLLCALALAIAWGFSLDALQVVGGGGARGGALSPMDHAIRIPAAHALALIALGVAVGSGLAVRWTRPAALVGLWATLGMAALLGRLVVPLLAEAWGAGASPAVAQALDGYANGYARTSFGLLGVVPRSVGARATAAGEAPRLAAALAGYSPWSGEPALLTATIAAAAGDTAPPRAWSTTFARYGDHSGSPRLVALAVSQIDPLALARLGPRPGWTETHRGALAWAGEPLAMDVGGAGGGRFLASLAPVDTAPAPQPVTRAPGRIRFLPGPAELAIVSPDEATIDEPAPGVRLGAFARRLLLAWALQSPPLLSGRTGSADRVLFWRDLPSRLSRLYPFAAFDPARPAIVGGRLLWIADGYLVSSRFPLAEHVRWLGEEVNYVAAPYVVTVDAVSGRTRIYLRPPDARFAASIARGEGVETLPSDSLEPELRRQLSYPLGLFGAQVAMLARRGQGPGTAPWSLASQDSAGSGGDDATRLEPAVALLALDAARAELWLLLPLVDADGSRLAAVVAGTTGETGEPRLTLLRAAGAFPTPLNAAGRFTASPAVLTAAAALAGPEGAVRRGAVHVVPAGESFVYAQTLFATADRAREPPRARLVALLTDNRIGVGDDIPAAAQALREGEGGAAGALAAAAALAEARAAFLALDSALRRADWAGFGRAYAALRRALQPGGQERP